VLALVALTVALAWKPFARHVAAASLLVRFAEPSATTGLATVERREVDAADATFSAPAGPVRARLYTPRDVADAPGMVIVHGVHRLGIDEPRLVSFARAMAATGVVVLTPEVRGLADYRVGPDSTETIGAAARELATRLGGRPVGLAGMSFAGGLSLLAAADPRFAPSVGAVLAVGAHHDLERVSRFFAENRIERPDGTVLDMKAHDYGPLVVVYAHAERFFAPEDVDAARDALRLWLWERFDDAKKRAEAVGPRGRATLARLFSHEVAAVAPDLEREIAGASAEMTPVSPRGHLAGLRAPVFLLHGAGDTVIPPTETLWLAREVPGPALRDVLVSEAISHVSLQGEPSALDRLRLVRFMADVLEAIDHAERPRAEG
jgi:dienelactone hydrolase